MDVSFSDIVQRVQMLLRRDLKLGPVPMRLTFRGTRNPFDRGGPGGR